MQDYEISEHFEEIRENLLALDSLNQLEKEELIDALFDFLKYQDPEMDENFSFIHLIENIEHTNQEKYYIKLIEFSKINGTITSILLLNRYTNSLTGGERLKCIQLLKSIAENNQYTDYVREFALSFYQYQIERQQN